MAWVKMTVPRIRFTRFGNDDTVDWSTIKAVKFIYRAIAGSTGVAKFDDLYVTAGADGNALTGLFRVRYKFVFEDGTFVDESLPSPVSAPVGLSAEALQMTIPQASAIAMDPQTTAIWPYIWSATMGAYYRTISPISMNRAKKTLNEWGAFLQDGLISADDRLRILTIGRCYGRRYTPGNDPIYSVPGTASTTSDVSDSSTVTGVGYSSGDVYSGTAPTLTWTPVSGTETALFAMTAISGNVSAIASVTTNVGFSTSGFPTSITGGYYHVCRIGGVNYFGALKIYNIGTGNSSSQVWATNPSSGSAWTQSDLNNAYFGVSIDWADSSMDRLDISSFTRDNSYTITNTGNTVQSRNILTFRIQTSESALLQRNEKLPVGREAPPDDIIDIVGSHFTRTLCLSSDYLYISDPGHPSLYPIFQSIKVSDGVNEQNLWMHKAAGSVYIGTTKDIYRLVGSLVEFPNGTLDASLIAMNIGSPPISSAVAFEGNSLVYLASDGPRMLVGESSTPLRGDLNLLLLGQTRHGVPPISVSTGRHRLAMSNGYLYWAVPPQDTAVRRHSLGEWLGSPTGEITASDRRRIATVGFGAVQEGGLLRYDFANQRWSRRPYSRVFRSITRGQAGQVLAGTATGEVVKLETGTLDGTRDIPITILTTQQDNANPLARKVPFDISIRMDTGGATAVIGVYLDGASTPSTTFEASTSGQQIYKASIASLSPFRRAQLKFEGAFSTFKLWDWNISYRGMPQHHYYLDTGNVEVGNEYQWYREITMLVKSDNDLMVDVYFDDVLLSTNTVTVTAGVTTQYQIPLGRAVRGRQPRVVVRTTASASANEDGFECYWVQWKVRESGNVSQKKIIKWSAVTK